MNFHTMVHPAVVEDFGGQVETYQNGGSKASVIGREAIILGRALSSVPSQMKEELRTSTTVSPLVKEDLVLAIALMGFLNKVMDAFGTPLEENVVKEARRVFGNSWPVGNTALHILFSHRRRQLIFVKRAIAGGHPS